MILRNDRSNGAYCLFSILFGLINGYSNARIKSQSVLKCSIVPRRHSRPLADFKAEERARDSRELLDRRSCRKQMFYSNHQCGHSQEHESECERDPYRDAFERVDESPAFWDRRAVEEKNELDVWSSEAHRVFMCERNRNAEERCEEKLWGCFWRELYEDHLRQEEEKLEKSDDGCVEGMTNTRITYCFFSIYVPHFRVRNFAAWS